MKILSWNPYGLGNPQKFRTLRELLKKEDLDLIFLQETKVKTSYFTTKKFHLGFCNSLGVGCEGNCGGLTVLRKEDVKYDILQFLNQHIHGLISTQSEGERP